MNVQAYVHGNTAGIKTHACQSQIMTDMATVNKTCEQTTVTLLCMHVKG